MDMDISGRRMGFIIEVPLPLKAGLPMLLSIGAGYLCSRIISKINPSSPVSDAHSSNYATIQNQPTLEPVNSSFATSSCTQDGEEHPIESIDGLHLGDIEEMLSGLKIQLEILNQRELELEARFAEYYGLKEGECKLMELKHTTLLELNRAEFMEKEVELMEVENQRLGELVVEFLRIFGLVEGLKLENKLTKRKARKLWLSNRGKSRVVSGMKQDLKKVTRGKDAEVGACKREIENKDDLIGELKGEISMLKSFMDQLCREKIELCIKLEMAQKSVVPEPEIRDHVDDDRAKEEYNKILKELEEIQRDRAAEEQELIHLRRSNACLRHELLRYQGQQIHTDQEDGDNHLGVDFQLEGNHHYHEHYNGNGSLDHDDEHWDHDHADHVSGIDGQHHSRRKRFMNKLKKLVEHGGKLEDNKDHKHKHHCFPRKSISEELVDYHEEVVHARKSCSSVSSSTNSVLY